MYYGKIQIYSQRFGWHRYQRGFTRLQTRNDVIRMLGQNNYYPLKIEKVLQVKDIRILASGQK